MSRRKKNLRAFLHSNPAPTVEEAWDAAWEGAQKHYHSKTMNELEAKLEEHERRWRWLNRSILEISKDGYSEWASATFAVINMCRYEELEGE